MKFLSSLLGFIFLALALCFAVSNREYATISLWPSDTEFRAPLYILTLGTLIIGLMVGTFIGWAFMVPHRLRARRLAREVADLTRQIETMKQTVIAPVSRIESLFASKTRRLFRSFRR